MKRWKLLIPAILLISIFVLAACNPGGGDGDITTTSAQTTTGQITAGETNLQLLRIETEDATGDFLYKSATLSRAVSPRAMEMPVLENTESNVTEIDSTRVTLVAVIKNEERASFIDMVVYNSQNGKTVVYNEGNGAYQCSSETVYEDGMWVTNIRFSVDAVLMAEDFYFEIKEIKFLRNNTDEKADLNTLDVRKKDLRFTTEYFDRMATNGIVQTLDCLEYDDLLSLEFDFEKKTVKLMVGVIYVDAEVSTDHDLYIADSLFLVLPETVRLKYYHNRVETEGDFEISELLFKHIQGTNGHVMRVRELTTNVKLSTWELIYAKKLIYPDGTKTCYISQLFATAEISIPSSCTEIVSEFDQHPDGLELVYDGTAFDFGNIKGATELIAWLETAGKPFTIVCTDATIGTTSIN